jgi:hypothetical protein
MIGTYPTVGCLILIDKLCFTSMEDVLPAFQALIPSSYKAIIPVSRGEAVLGGSMHPMLLMVQEMDKMTAVHIEFDEDEVESISKALGLSVEQLFMPYVQAARTLPGVIAIGLGFELSPPRDLQEKSLQEAGIAVLFERDEKHKSWDRQQTMPLVGHNG